jgi:peptidoglycan/LPS O-acetylase OafA/YrhL
MRYRTLDSVRGLAAVTVLLHHIAMTFPGGGEHRQELLAHGYRSYQSWLYATPLRLAVSGPAAVMLFFVLSGFVLTLNLNSARQPSYGAFGAARFARIWIPFCIAIMVASVLSSFLAGRPAPGVSPMFLHNWSQPVTLGSIARHLAMTGSAVDLDGPMWSLIHELRISFLFPLLLLLTTRFSALSFISSVLMSLTCVWLIGRGEVSGHVTTFVQTATYVYFFVVGILVATHADFIRSFLCSLPRWTLGCLWIIALTGLTFSPADTSHVAAIGNGLLLIISGLCAGVIIALCTTGGVAERFLLAPVPRFLGRISYSLYLTHMIVMAAVIHAVAGALPLSACFAIILPLAVVVANLSQRYVEAPTQRFGKLLADRIDRAGTGRPRWGGAPAMSAQPRLGTELES